MPSNIIVCHLTHTIIYSRKTGFCSTFVTEFSIPFCFLTTMKMSYRKYTIIVVSSDMASCFCKRNGLGHFNIFFYDNFLSCHYNFVNLLFATVSNIYVTDPSMAYKGLQNYVITNKKLSLLFSIMWHPRKLECPTSEFC